MGFIVWIEVDLDFFLAEIPISIDGVQFDREVFRGKFGYVSPLTASKPLENQE